jgi:hypothetical protein
MKQLLLNFLFFVAAAFIFIQCAKLFPSQIKTTAPAPVIQKDKLKKSEVENDRKGQLTSYNFLKAGSQTGAIISYLDNGVFPLNMIRYLKRNPFLFRHNLGFYYTDIYGRPVYPYLGFAYPHLLTAQVAFDQVDNYVRNR